MFLEKKIFEQKIQKNIFNLKIQRNFLLFFRFLKIGSANFGI